ncbi:hypothetical protein APHAL10511_003209 [Amanita phalloides]|nr:hypothetical protein APHAL10511_003209 [Amanita phalloides]
MSNITALVLQERSEPNGAISFNDMQGRLSVSYRCTVNGEKGRGSTWSIFDQTGLGGGAFVPVFMLEFGRNNALGVIHTGPKECMSMKKYLGKTSLLGNSRVRKFTATDGKEYIWSHREIGEYEWVCMDVNADIVSYYRRGGTSRAGVKSNNILVVEERCKKVACDFVATLMIMRHILVHNL